MDARVNCALALEVINREQTIKLDDTRAP